MAAVEYKFVAEPDDALKCSICLDVAKDPKQEEECGKLFCSDCIENWEEDSCPTCRTGEPRYFKDKKSHREIQALVVRCNNVENGCVWEGTIGTLQDHLAECDFILVPCPNGCSVSDKESASDKNGDSDVFHLIRSDMEKHLSSECPMRQYQCPDCGLEDKYRVITGSHEEECEKKIVTCPNTGCNVSGERGVVRDHVKKSCEYTIISCKYASIGCKEKMMRKYITHHENKYEYHLPIALGKISYLNDIIMHGLPFTAKESQRRITFKLKDYSKRKESKKEVIFEPFFTSPTGYKMCLSVSVNGSGKGKGTHLSVFTELLHGPHDDQLKWPFTGTVTVELLNQEEDARHYKGTIHYDLDNPCGQAGGKGWGQSKFITHENLANGENSQAHASSYEFTFSPARKFGKVQRRQVVVIYLKDDTLYFRLTVQEKNYKRWLETY